MAVLPTLGFYSLSLRVEHYPPESSPLAGEDSGGGKNWSLLTPTQTLPHRGGGERGPWVRG
jgi:hypothetical protein